MEEDNLQQDGNQPINNGEKNYFDLFFGQQLSTESIKALVNQGNDIYIPTKEEEAKRLNIEPNSQEFENYYNTGIESYERYKIGAWNLDHMQTTFPKRSIDGYYADILPPYDPEEVFKFVPHFPHRLPAPGAFNPAKEASDQNVYLTENDEYKPLSDYASFKAMFKSNKLVLDFDKDTRKYIWRERPRMYPSQTHEERSIWGHDHYTPPGGWVGAFGIGLASFVPNTLAELGTGLPAFAMTATDALTSWMTGSTSQMNKLNDAVFDASVEEFDKLYGNSGLDRNRGQGLDIFNDIMQEKKYEILKTREDEFPLAVQAKKFTSYGRSFKLPEYIGMSSTISFLHESGHMAGIILASSIANARALKRYNLAVTKGNQYKWIITPQQAHLGTNIYFGIHSMATANMALTDLDVPAQDNLLLSALSGAYTFGVFQSMGNILRGGTVTQAGVTQAMKDGYVAQANMASKSLNKSVSAFTQKETEHLLKRWGNWTVRQWNNPTSRATSFIFGGTQEGLKFGTLGILNNLTNALYDEYSYFHYDYARPGHAMLGELNEDSLWGTITDRVGEGFWSSFASGFVAGVVSGAIQTAGAIIKKPEKGQSRWARERFKYQARKLSMVDIILQKGEEKIYKSIEKMEADNEFSPIPEENKRYADMARQEVASVVEARDRALMGPNAVEVAGNMHFLKEGIILTEQMIEKEKALTDTNISEADKETLQREIEELKVRIDEYLKPFGPQEEGKITKSKKYQESMLRMMIANIEPEDKLTKTNKKLYEVKEIDGNKIIDFSKIDKIIDKYKLAEKDIKDFYERKITELRESKERNKNDIEQVNTLIDKIDEEIASLKGKNVKEYKESVNTMRGVLNEIETLTRQVTERGMSLNHMNSLNDLKGYLNYYSQVKFGEVSREAINKARENINKFKEGKGIEELNQRSKELSDQIRDPRNSSDEKALANNELIKIEKQINEINNSKEVKVLENDIGEIKKASKDVHGVEVLMDAMGEEVEMSPELPIKFHNTTEELAEEYERLTGLDDNELKEHYSKRYFIDKIREFGRLYNIDVDAYKYVVGEGYVLDMEYVEQKLREDGVDIENWNDKDAVKEAYFEKYNHLEEINESIIDGMNNLFNGTDTEIGLVDLKNYLHIKTSVNKFNREKEFLFTQPDPENYGYEGEYFFDVIEHDYNITELMYNTYQVIGNTTLNMLDKQSILKTQHAIIKNIKVAKWVSDMIAENGGIYDLTGEGKDGGLHDILLRFTKSKKFTEELLLRISKLAESFEQTNNQPAIRTINDKEHMMRLATNMADFETTFFKLINNLTEQGKNYFFRTLGQCFTDLGNSSTFGYNSLTGNIVWNADMFLAPPDYGARTREETESVGNAIKDKATLDNYHHYQKKYIIQYLATISRIDTQEFYHVMKAIRGETAEKSESIFFNNDQMLTALHVVSKILNMNDDSVLRMELGVKEAEALVNKSKEPISEYYATKFMRRAIMVNGHPGVGKSTMLNLLFNALYKIQLERNNNQASNVKKAKILFVSNDLDVANNALENTIGTNKKGLNDNSNFISLKGENPSKVITFKEYSESSDKYKGYDFIIFDEAQQFGHGDISYIRDSGDIRYDANGNIDKSSLKNAEKRNTFFLFLGDVAQSSKYNYNIIAVTEAMENTEIMTLNKRSGVVEIFNTEQAFRKVLENPGSQVVLNTAYQKTTEGGKTRYKGVRIFKSDAGGQRELRANFKEVYDASAKNGEKIMYIVGDADDIPMIRKALGIPDNDNIVEFRAIKALNGKEHLHMAGKEAPIVFVDYVVDIDNVKSISEYVKDMLTAVSRAERYLAFTGEGASTERSVLDTSLREYKDSARGKQAQETELQNRQMQKEFTDVMALGEGVEKRPISTSSKQAEKPEVKKPPAKPEGAASVEGEGDEREGTVEGGGEDSGKEKKPITKYHGEKITRPKYEVTIPQGTFEVSKNVKSETGQEISKGDIVEIDSITEHREGRKIRYEVKLMDSDDIYMLTPGEFDKLAKDMTQRGKKPITEETEFDGIESDVTIKSDIKNSVRQSRRAWSFLKNNVLSGVLKEGAQNTIEFLKKVAKHFKLGDNIKPNSVTLKARMTKDGVVIETHIQNEKVGEIYGIDDVMKDAKLDYKTENIEAFKKAVREKADERFGKEPTNKTVQDYKQAFIEYNTKLFVVHSIANETLNQTKAESIEIGIDEAGTMTGGYIRYQKSEAPMKVGEFLKQEGLTIVKEKGKVTAKQEKIVRSNGEEKVRTYIKVRSEKFDGAEFELEIISQDFSFGDFLDKDRLKEVKKDYDINTSVGNKNKSELYKILNYNRSTLGKLLNSIPAHDWNGLSEKGKNAIYELQKLLTFSKNGKSIDIKDIEVTESVIKAIFDNIGIAIVEINTAGYEIGFYNLIEKTSSGDVSIDIDKVETNAVGVNMPELKLSTKPLDKFITDNGYKLNGEKIGEIKQETVSEQKESIEKQEASSVTKEERKKNRRRTITLNEEKAKNEKFVTVDEAVEEIRKEMGDEWTNEHVVIIDKKLENANGEKVYGYMRAGNIYITTAEQGTVPEGLFWHEITHVDLNYKVSNKERNVILKSAKELIKLRGEHIDPDNMTNEEVEEWISETKREWTIKINKGQAEVGDIGASTNRFFLGLNALFNERSGKLLRAMPALRYLEKTFTEQYYHDKPFLSNSHGIINDHIYAMSGHNRVQFNITSMLTNDHFLGDLNLYSMAKRDVKDAIVNFSTLNKKPNGYNLTWIEALRQLRSTYVLHSKEEGDTKVVVGGEEKLVSQLTKSDINKLDLDNDNDWNTLGAFIDYQLGQKTVRGDYVIDNIARTLFPGVKIEKLLPEADIKQMELVERIKYLENELTDTPETDVIKRNNILIDLNNAQNEIEFHRAAFGDMFNGATEVEMDKRSTLNYKDVYMNIEGSPFIDMLYSTFPVLELTEGGNIITKKDADMGERGVRRNKGMDVDVLKQKLIQIAKKTGQTYNKETMSFESKWEAFKLNLEKAIESERYASYNNNKTGQDKYPLHYQMLKSWYYEMFESPYSYEKQTQDPVRFIGDMLQTRNDVPLDNDGNRFTIDDVRHAIRLNSGIIEKDANPEMDRRMTDKFLEYVDRHYKRIYELDVMMNAIRSEYTSTVALNGTGTKLTQIAIKNEAGEIIFHKIMRKFASSVGNFDEVFERIKRTLNGNYNTSETEDIATYNEDIDVKSKGENVGRIATLSPDKMHIFDTSKGKAGINVSVDLNTKQGFITIGGDTTPLLIWSLSDKGSLRVEFNSEHQNPIESSIKLMRKIGIPIKKRDNVMMMFGLIRGGQTGVLDYIKDFAEGERANMPNKGTLAEMLMLSTVALKVSREISMAKIGGLEGATKYQGHFRIKGVEDGKLKFQSFDGTENTSANFLQESLYASGEVPDRLWGEATTSDGNTTKRLNFMPSDFWRHLQSYAIVEYINAIHAYHNHFYSPSGDRLLNYTGSGPLTNMFTHNASGSANIDLLFEKTQYIMDRVMKGRGMANNAILSLPFIRQYFFPYDNPESSNKEVSPIQIASLENFLGVRMGERGEGVGDLTMLDYITSVFNGMTFDSLLSDAQFETRIFTIGQPGGDSSKTPVFGIVSPDGHNIMEFSKNKYGKITNVTLGQSKTVIVRGKKGETRQQLSKADYSVDSFFNYYSKLYTESLNRWVNFLNNYVENAKPYIRMMVKNKLEVSGVNKLSTIIEKFKNGNDINSIANPELGLENELHVLKKIQTAVAQIVGELYNTSSKVEADSFVRTIRESNLIRNSDYRFGSDGMSIGRTTLFYFDDVYNQNNFQLWNDVKNKNIEQLSSFRTFLFRNRLKALTDRLYKVGWKLPKPLLDNPDIFQTGVSAQDNITGLKKNNTKTYDVVRRNAIINANKTDYFDKYFEAFLESENIIRATDKEGKEYLAKTNEKGKLVDLGVEETVLRDAKRKELHDKLNQITSFYDEMVSDKDLRSSDKESVNNFFEEILDEAISTMFSDANANNFANDALVDEFKGLVRIELAKAMMDKDGDIQIVSKGEYGTTIGVLKSIHDNFTDINNMFMDFDKSPDSYKDVEYHPFIEGTFMTHHIVNSIVTAVMRGDPNSYSSAIDFYKRNQNSYRQGQSLAESYSGMPEKSNIFVIKSVKDLMKDWSMLHGHRSDIKQKERQPINSRLNISNSEREFSQALADGLGVVNPLVERMHKIAIGGDIGRMGEGMQKMFVSSMNLETGFLTELKYGLMPITADMHKSRVADNMLKLMFGPELYRAYRKFIDVEGLDFDSAMDKLGKIVLDDLHLKKSMPDSGRTLYDSMIHQIVTDKSAHGQINKINQVDVFGHMHIPGAEAEYSNFFTEINNYHDNPEFEQYYGDFVDSRSLKVSNRDIYFQLNLEQDMLDKTIKLAKQWSSQIGVGRNNKERVGAVNKLMVQYATNVFNKMKSEMGYKNKRISSQDFMAYLKQLASNASLQMRHESLLHKFLLDEKLNTDIPGFGDMMLPMLFNKFNEGIRVKGTGARAILVPDFMIERVWEPETQQWVSKDTFRRIHGEDVMPEKDKLGLETTRYLNEHGEEYRDTTSEELDAGMPMLYAHEKMEADVAEGKAVIVPEEIMIAFPHVNEFFNGDKSIQLHDITIRFDARHGRLTDIRGFGTYDQMYEFVEFNIDNMHSLGDKEPGQFEMPEVVKKMAIRYAINKIGELEIYKGHAKDLNNFLEKGLITSDKIKNLIRTHLVGYYANYLHSFNETLDVITTRIPLETSAFVTRTRIAGFTNNSANLIYLNPKNQIRSSIDYDGDAMSIYYRNVKKDKYGLIQVPKVKDINNIDFRSLKDNDLISNTIIEHYMRYYDDPQNILRNNIILSTANWAKAIRDYHNDKSAEKRIMTNKVNDLNSALHFTETNRAAEKLIGIFANAVDALAMMANMPQDRLPIFLHGLDKDLDIEYSIPVESETQPGEWLSEKVRIESKQLTKLDYLMQDLRTLIDLAVDDPKLGILGPAGVDENIANVVIAAALDKQKYKTPYGIISFLKSNDVQYVLSRVVFGQSLGHKSITMFDAIKDIAKEKYDVLHDITKSQDLRNKYKNVFEIDAKIDKKQKARIRKWLVDNDYIIHKSDIVDGALVEKEKRTYFSEDINDYIVKVDKEKGIKGLNAITRDNIVLPEQEWMQKSIDGLIGESNDINDIYSKPGGLLKYALEGEWMKNLSMTLGIAGGAEVKDWDAYRQLRSFEDFTGITMEEFANAKFISSFENNKYVLNEQKFNDYISKKGYNIPTKDIYNFIAKERAIKEIGDIGQIVFSMPHIKEWFFQFAELKDIVSKNMFMYSDLINDLMEDINRENHIGPLVWKTQYYAIKEALSKRLLASYFATLPENARIIELPFYFESSAELGLRDVGMDNIDIKDHWGQQLFFKSFADMIKGFQTMRENTNAEPNKFIDNLVVNHDWVDIDGVASMKENSFEEMRRYYSYFLTDIKNKFENLENPIYDMDKKVDRMFQIYQLLKSGFNSKQKDFISIIGIDEFSKIGDFFTQFHNYHKHKTGLLKESDVTSTQGTMFFDDIYREFKAFKKDIPVLVDGIALRVKAAEEYGPYKPEVGEDASRVPDIFKEHRYNTIAKDGAKRGKWWFNFFVQRIGENVDSEEGLYKRIDTDKLSGNRTIDSDVLEHAGNKTSNLGLTETALLHGANVVRVNENTIVLRYISLETHRKMQNQFDKINADENEGKYLLLKYTDIEYQRIRDMINKMPVNKSYIVIYGRIFKYMGKDDVSQIYKLEPVEKGSYKSNIYDSDRGRTALFNVTNSTVNGKEAKQISSELNNGIDTEKVKNTRTEVKRFNRGTKFGDLSNTKQYAKEHNISLADAIRGFGEEYESRRSEDTPTERFLYKKDGTGEEYKFKRVSALHEYPGGSDMTPKQQDVVFGRGHVLEAIADNAFKQVRAEKNGEEIAGIDHSHPPINGKYIISDFFSEIDVKAIHKMFMNKIKSYGDVDIFEKVIVFGDISHEGKQERVAGEIDFMIIQKAKKKGERDKVIIIDTKSSDAPTDSKKTKYYKEQVNFYKAVFESMYGVYVDEVSLWHLKATDKNGDAIRPSEYHFTDGRYTEKNWSINEVKYSTGEMEEGKSFDTKKLGKDFDTRLKNMFNFNC